MLATTTDEDDEAAAARALKRRLQDRRWRLNNLYTVENEEGLVLPFRMKPQQKALFEALHARNIIPKARQIGFTTFILLMMLDACLFNSNTRCAVIAHDKDAAKELFEQKVRRVYERLPAWLRAAVPAAKNREGQLDFGNGSQLRVTTSTRSGTVHWLHISEHGKICAKYPGKAKEIRTGALPAATSEKAVVFVESTGEGQAGDFYDWCQAAKRRADLNAALTPLDFKLHFFPWHEEPRYVLPAGSVIIEEPLARYFAELKEKHGLALSPEQQAWYAKTWETQRDEMFREYPSVYEEVFKTAIEGAFFTLEMQALRRDGRLTSVPYEIVNGPVHRAWDIGVDDYTAVWFFQLVGRRILFIDYDEWFDCGLPTVHADLEKRRQERGYVYGYDVMPHDIQVLEWGSEQTRIAAAEALGYRVIKAESPAGIVGERIGIIRNVFPRFWIDEQRCALGVKRLDAYRREWDERLGAWLPRPRHDEASHGASALGVGMQKLEMLPVATTGGYGGAHQATAFVPRPRAS